jgi:hypothetical protein
MGRKKIPEDQKATKPGVSMDKECRLILSKLMEYEASVRNDLAQSQAIRKCMKIAWDLHYKALFEKYEATQNMDGIALLNEESAQKNLSKASNIAPPVSVEGNAASPERAIAPILRPEDRSVGGSSTRSTGRSRGNG